MSGDHVGILDRRHIDALLRGDVGERLQTVAQCGCALEPQILSRRRHLGLKAFLNIAALAGQEGTGVVQQNGVVLLRDAADARRGAALDLVLQAGPVTAAEDGVIARPQRESA